MARALKSARTLNIKRANNATVNNTRAWKFVAIGVIILFAAFVIFGIVRAHGFRHSFVKASKENAAFALGIAKAKMESLGINSSGFNAVVLDEMRRPGMKNESKRLLPVEFSSSNATHTFLIDISSGKAVMHSETEIYDGFARRGFLPLQHFRPFAFKPFALCGNAGNADNRSHDQ